MTDEQIQIITENNTLPDKTPPLPPVTLAKSPNKKIIIATMMIIGLGIWIGAFFLAKIFPVSKPQPSKVLPTLTPKITPSGEVIESSASGMISRSHNMFGFNLLEKLQIEDQVKNIFISPSSIALALSMVYNGADLETKDAIAKTLQVQGIDINQVNQSNLALINLLKNPDPKVQLSIANSIWAREGVVFQPNFLELNKNYYQAEISSLDFTDEGSAQVINSWVKDNTQGKITKIVNPPIPPEMVMYLINAIYFKGNWTVEFDKKLTEERDFTLLGGQFKKQAMMQQKGNYPYLENDLFQAINLPYGENKRLGMYVFLPKENFVNFTSLLDINSWEKWLAQFKEMEGTILIPKFKIEYEKKLNDTLKSLGMEIAFGDKANFTKIAPSLFISEVIHKTYVDVNEEGTEAAAVTEIGVGMTAIGPEKKTFYMEVNKPFYFAIVDNQTAEILFMGLIVEPK